MTTRPAPDWRFRVRRKRCFAGFGRGWQDGHPAFCVHRATGPYRAASEGHFVGKVITIHGRIPSARGCSNGARTTLR
ncbi:hypothetical protein AA0614_2460 [Komagataeibacter saccharivorans NRIC 0614]|nr:hypothetical protein AA0614_2460 [Komagataeibacter saccharivorans NRIC 0614]